MKLTGKQEKFCLAYTETGNASEAYRQAYNCSKMKQETIKRNAFRLTEMSKIRATLEQLQADAAARNEITVDDLIKELEDARQVAIADRNPAAMIAATMGKAKICGFDGKKKDDDDDDVPVVFWVGSQHNVTEVFT